MRRLLAQTTPGQAGTALSVAHKESRLTACTCRGIGLFPRSRWPRRCWPLSRLLTSLLAVTLALPLAVGTLDVALLAEAGAELEACEGRVKHLTTEVGRLQAQLLALQRANGEPTRSGHDGTIGGLRDETVTKASPGVSVPSEITVGREGLHDANRRRQEAAGILRAHPVETHACMQRVGNSLFWRPRDRDATR